MSQSRPTMVTSPTLRLIAMMCVLTILGACSPITLTGKRKVLAFEVVDQGSFSRESPADPIASGSRVTFDVQRTFTEGEEASTSAMVLATSILSADTTPRGIIDVLEVEHNRVTVEARNIGTTELLVMSDQGADTLTVRVAPVLSASVSHWSRGDFGAALIPGHPASNVPPPASFLTGGVGRFVVHAYGTNNVSLTGFGTSPPLRVSPTSRAKLLPSPEGELQFVEVLFQERGTVKLRPRAGTVLDLRVDDPGDVSGLTLHTRSRAVEVGETTTVAVYGSVGAASEQRLLLGSVSTVRSATPDVCEVAEESRRYGDGLYAVRGIAEGTCSVVSSLGDLTETREIVVTPRRRRS